MKHILLFIAIVSSALISSCGGNKETAASADLAPGEYDLSQQGLNIIIKAPSEPLVQPSAGGGYDVQSSDVFNLFIRENALGVEEKKKEITSDGISQVSYAVDEPNAILYEKKLGDNAEYHFYVVIKNDKTSFEIMDNPAKQYTQDDIKAMLEATKSSRVK